MLNAFEDPLEDLIEEPGFDAYADLETEEAVGEECGCTVPLSPRSRTLSLRRAAARRAESRTPRYLRESTITGGLRTEGRARERG